MLEVALLLEQVLGDLAHPKGHDAPYRSPLEIELRRVLLRLQPVICPELVIEEEQEIGPYRADFLLTFPNGLRVVVECDGWEHHYATRSDVLYDRRRDRWMSGAGLVVLRFLGTEIQASAARCAGEILRVGMRLDGCGDPVAAANDWLKAHGQEEVRHG